MPRYELLCLVKPKVGRPEVAGLMKRCGEVLFGGGAVIMDVKSYGEQSLAYDIRRPFEKYGEAQVWQMDFLVKTDVLPALNHEIKVNDSVLRYVIVQRPQYKHNVRQLMDMVFKQERRDARIAAQPPPVAQLPME